MKQRHDTTGAAAGADRLEIHHRQQLSALVDGDLAPDEARFLLRRLQHDQELAGCYERWQLYGQALRGQVRDLAAPDFGARVAAAVQAEAATAAAAPSGARRATWTRWGGGA
ncbi:MAG TPA: sigma-E factor negative regulatory protein, partial [Pseudoxanthomonas sp.]|nr:sigma-E factor negative regulatory protein [Pseudoxanthomonas sp.]